VRSDDSDALIPNRVNDCEMSARIRAPDTNGPEFSVPPIRFNRKRTVHDHLFRFFGLDAVAGDMSRVRFIPLELVPFRQFVFTV